jgi:ElaB/YqjD/DUF883 family membrane-anchored ribosome-binding protein
MRLLAAIVFLTLCSGCTRLYYASMEKIGREKRDILVARIKDGKKDQENAKKQFQSALEAFQALTGFTGGDLEKTYNKLNDELRDSEQRAQQVSDRIRSIDQVAGDLFKEWDKEIAGMRDAKLKTRSRQMLAETRQRHRQLMAKMRLAEERMKPVLQRFHDQVYFLKHNLNAKAIASLKTTRVELDGEVDNLVKRLDASIEEADSYIASLSAATD